MFKNICILAFASFLLISCKKSKSDNISRVIEEWMGKEIIYPDGMTFTLWGKDTIMECTDYTIVTYVDTTGCISCKLQLKNWYTFITDLEDNVGNKVKTTLYFFLRIQKR